jgi:hypothetical protein
MDAPPPYSEQIRTESIRKSLFDHYFHLNEQWSWKITQEGADFAKEQFIQSVKNALAANQPVSWGLLLQVLYEYLGVNVDIKTGIGAFPHMERMSYLLDFDLSKKEEQYGLASLMIAAFGSEDPHDAPQDVRYDPEQDVVNFFIRCPLDDLQDATLSKEMWQYIQWDLEIRNASSKERRELVRLKATIENPSQDIQEKFAALKV